MNETLSPIGNTRVPKKRSEIDIQLGELENSIVALDKEIERLEAKLSPVLQKPAEVKESGESDEKSLSPLANTIRHKRRMILGVVKRIRGIQERVEL